MGNDQDFTDDLIDQEIDDAECLSGLFAITENELPAPRPKTKRKRKGRP